MIAASLGIKQTIGRDLAEPGHYSDLVVSVECDRDNQLRMARSIVEP